MLTFLKQLFCKHDWKTFIQTIPIDYTKPLIVKECIICGKEQSAFKFGRAPEPMSNRKQK